jgi:hypothetical protein
MAFGIPKIDVPAITAMFNEKFAQLLGKLQEILDELKGQHDTMKKPPE